MSRNTKLITALLSIILCFSICSFAVFAADMNGDGYDDETGEYIGEVIVTDPIVPDPVVTDPVTIETDPVVIETDPVTIETEPVATEYVPVETQAVTNAPSYEVETDPVENYWEVENEDNGDDDEIYVGGGQTYVEPVETAPSAALYDSNHKIDDNELSDNDWKDISANLKNASASDSDDGDDFNFIKKNDSTADNGDWMLIVGLVLLLLGIAGIVYVIASAVIRRKKMKNMPTGQLATATSGSGRYRSNSDYDDGYRSERKKLDKSRKFDTADVKLPKNSNGRRYR